MIKLSIQIASQTLYRPVTVTVMLPYTLTTGKGPFRVLYALHPAMENSGIFLEKLYLSEKVDKYKVAIVAPDLGNGYFINTPYEKQANFLQTELMPVLCDMLPLSVRREDNMLLGISMGAFGAAHWALSCPEHFSKVALISGVFDASLPVDERALKSRELRPLVKLFSEKVMPQLMRDASGNVFPDADIRPLYAKAAACGAPRFALWYGDKDYLSIDQSRHFFHQCELHGIKAKTYITPGAHNISYWQYTVNQAFDWLMVKNDFSC